MSEFQYDLETAAVEPIASVGLGIEGMSEPAIAHYFQTINTGDFQATAALFAQDGVLYPPFEAAVVGEEAIAAYLEAEAKGMQLQPHQGIAQSLETGETQVEVTGNVQTPVLGVNANWLFALNSHSQILSVNISLLASPQELLNIQQ
jgi:hypothetical protein